MPIDNQESKMSTFRVLHASVLRDSGILRVVPEGDPSDDSLSFSVEGEPDKRLQFRTARPIYDSNGELLSERIFVVDRPEFDLTTLIGKRICNV